MAKRTPTRHATEIHVPPADHPLRRALIAMMSQTAKKNISGWVKMDAAAFRAAFGFISVTGPDGSAPVIARLPPFDAEKAKALLVDEKAHSYWGSLPTEDDTRTFLLGYFNGVPNDAHRRIRREVWAGQIKRGPRPKRQAAE